MFQPIKASPVTAGIIAVVFFLIPALLFLPVFYYSLTTPFALVDDYHDWIHLEILDDPEHFFSWFRANFLNAENASFLYPGDRYRPFWEFYNAVAWQVFGPTPWLHHLSRWFFHFGAILTFAAAFWHISRPGWWEKAAGFDSSRFAAPLLFMPLALLVYIWLFFPNVPAARLGPQEVYSVFFLGLCNWMAALLLVGNAGDSGKGRWRQSTLPHYALFVLGYLGLVTAKEVGIAAALWLLIAWYVVALRRYGITRKGLLSGLPLLLIFGLALRKVYAATQLSGVGRGTGLTPELFSENLREIYSGLFQVESSGVITAGFILLAAALLLAVLFKAVRRRIDNELLFILFLLGQWASLHLILVPSYAVTLRYWYILLPIFAVLLAFGVKYLLAAAAARSKMLLYAVSFALTGFVLFFVAANYYNFLYQTVVQHSSRQVEVALIAQATQLHDAGEYVQVNPEFPDKDEDREEAFTLLELYPGYSARFHNREYVFHKHPPADAAQPWYSLDWYRPPGILPTYFTLSSHENYPLLTYARQLAAGLQGPPPHKSVGYSVVPLGEYRWSIYRRPVDMLAVAARLTEGAGTPAIRAAFDVYSQENRLTYIKERCTEPAAAARFTLKLFPVDAADLPPERRQYGNDNYDFDFDQYGIRQDGVCIAVRELPDYPLLTITTGQNSDELGRLWEERIDLNPFPAAAYAAYAAIQAGEWGPPLIRDYFDLYRGENNLAYVREPCSPADTKAMFSLHLTPADVADLAAERQGYGVDNWDFRFDNYGVRVAAACIAVRELPDYPILAIETSQYSPERGQIWESRIDLKPFAATARAAYTAIQAGEWGEPIARAGFDLYRKADTLAYVKESCGAADTAAGFFLHLTPADSDDLPEGRREFGFDNRDFKFDNYGVRVSGACVAVRELPGYPISNISTGQYSPEAGEIWKVAAAGGR